MWYTFTLLTGIHYGTGQRTADISVEDSLHAMRCWWLCFLAYATTMTLAKLSLGFFFLRLTSIMTLHRIVAYLVTASAVIVGVVFFFLSIFQCTPVDFFWTRLVGASGQCIPMDVMIGMTYLYGAVTATTDIAFGMLLALLVWNLNVERKTKFLIAPLLGLACVASYAALVRMPYVETFKKPDFLFATVEISLWSTVEVGVSVFAVNLATLRPLVEQIAASARSLSSRIRSGSNGGASSDGNDLQDFSCRGNGKPHVESVVVDLGVPQRDGDVLDGESTTSLTRSTRHIGV